MPVSHSNESCHYHTGQTCNAPTNHGEPCQRSVDDPDERCSLHSNSE
jgi:hypothetical protein